jgi:hypothetical protein
MKKLTGIAALIAATGMLASPGTTAQVSKDGMGKMVPVELYVCEFVEGKGEADLEPVIAQWSEFMDGQKIRDYAAWLLYPYYHGIDQSFDFVWMGAYKDGKAMGRGGHAWVTEGGPVAAAFDEVVHCPVHVGLTSAMYQSPPGNETPGSAILTMSDCTMNEGTRYSDVRAAELKWAAYLQEKGSESGTYHWFPDFGGGDQDFDYKIVNAYEDMQALGESWEMLANGGGRQQSNEIFDDIDECDDARVYVARSIRSAQLRK